jgi:uncharacterized protein (TIGR02246 family)
MRRISFFSPALIVVVTVTCAPQPAATFDIEAERTALRDADSRYSQAASAKDVEAVVALYAPDGAIYPPDGAVVTGLEGVRGFASAFVADSAFAARFTPRAVEVSADADMGYTLNDAEVTFTGSDGKPMTERIRDFHVWRKQPDGSWKIVVDIWNNEPPATPPTPTTTR